MSTFYPQSYNVSATLSAYRGVALTGTAHNVGYPEAVTRMPIGITIDDVKDINQGISVAGPGNIAKLYFNQTVSSGALVAVDTSGRGIVFTAAGTTTSSNAYLGVLVGPDIGATGTIAQVLVMPGKGG